MGGPFTFIASLFSFGAAGVMEWQECKKNEQIRQDWNEHNYSYSVQSDYDCNVARLNVGFSIERMKKAIVEDYPRMNDYNAFRVAIAAAAKKLMEEETPYEYKMKSEVSYFDLDKYTTDEFRRREDEWM